MCVRPCPGGGASVFEESVVAGPQSASVRTFQTSTTCRQKPPAAAEGGQCHGAGGARCCHGNCSDSFPLHVSLHQVVLSSLLSPSISFIPPSCSSSVLVFFFVCFQSDCVTMRDCVSAPDTCKPSPPIRSQHAGLCEQESVCDLQETV